MDHNTLGASQAAAKSEGIESCRKMQQASGEETSEVNQGQGGKNIAADVAPAHEKSHGDVNMEADITMDEVIRAGGLGARDDLNSVLPVAADTTDFEASIRDAWDYEGQRESITRPGLGWTEPAKK
ncbi:uncharacterized protein LOC129870547 isoform X1 [Solanum dulcamara]|uniref:uncharacterized protein LOC129870547 isoform X1 n=1 Tax=Solanum dulcamara TaxID=45834 RepID=UPI0024865E25|nr:uncharacterized protein LOC129870547 isoform X1 [Solanum dulcamara]XP_055801336.1 uncharacterized protein LOC129870547 isoform X1 [Solanum dulcamara]XP_055801337.1 uncharacterized protein LOC129870547 isoform X1 [Solanum dulcamara]XP_055801338.1 uncharacterized protein LOC129870547 isoform X1 [Solanum dulcamara]XP_055801339.1 uncharacterized protein LOC129870547 isoform X1 [Solanum dulcamara]XP_055801340.1 uncharacterized protein LOC129870547 isoform X1 [Solanum dulcamara]